MSSRNGPEGRAATCLPGRLGVTPWLRRTRWKRVQGLPTCCSIFGPLIWPVSPRSATTEHHLPPPCPKVMDTLPMACRLSLVDVYRADQRFLPQAEPSTYVHR